VWVPGRVLGMGGISQGAKLCYGVLDMLSDANGICDENQAEIGAAMGVSSRQASRYIDELAEQGLVSRLNREGKGNRYRINTTDTPDGKPSATPVNTDHLTDTPGNREGIIINNISDKEKNSTKTYPHGNQTDTSVYDDLSKDFYDLLLQQKPDYQNRLAADYLSKGADEFRKLIQIDGVTAQQCREVNRWVRRHRGRGFSWSDQVLSPAKYRTRRPRVDPDHHNRKIHDGPKYFFVFLDLIKGEGERRGGKEVQGVKGSGGYVENKY